HGSLAGAPASFPTDSARGAGVEGSPARLAGERRRVGRARAAERESRVSIPVFLVLAALTVASALTVIVHRNPIYSALGLVSTLFLLAVLFLGLDAQMVAVLQIIVYAGAIVVLFLFVIMLLNLQVEE